MTETPFSINEEVASLKASLSTAFERAKDSSGENRWSILDGLCIGEVIRSGEGEVFPYLAVLAEEVGRNLIGGDYLNYCFFNEYVANGNLGLSKDAGKLPLVFGDLTGLPLEIVDDFVGGSISPVEVANDDNISSVLLEIRQRGLVLYGLGVENKVELNSPSNHSSPASQSIVVEIKLTPEEVRTQLQLDTLNALDISRQYCGFTFVNPVRKLRQIAAPRAWHLKLCYRLLRVIEIASISETVLDMTVSYVQTRTQFSRPVGSFQAVQHGLADVAVKVKALRSLIDCAIWNVEQGTNDQDTVILAAICRATEWGPWIVERAMQYHGGIGFTWEYPLHKYLRRVKQLAVLCELSSSEEEYFVHSV